MWGHSLAGGICGIGISVVKDTLLFKFMKNKLTLQVLFTAYIV